MSQLAVRTHTNESRRVSVRKCPRAADLAQNPPILQRKHRADAPIAARVTSPTSRMVATPTREERAADPAKLPPRLRTNVEALSGLAMDDVRVHRNSAEPAKLGALAFTRGTDIHLSPGEERHLPHEAWHVVQQKQGRVAATEQYKGVSINADAALEHEADRASSRIMAPCCRSPGCLMAARAGDNVVQRQKADKADKPPFTTAPPKSSDLVILLNPKLMTEAKIVAPGARIVEATTLDELAKKLKAIGGSVDTLHFLAHMTEDGDILFEPPDTMSFEPASKIAEKLKGTIQVNSISFQGCSIAQTPADMQVIAGALKATKATGSTCALVEHTSGPVKVDGKAITKPAQLNSKKVKTAFDKGFKQLRETFEDKKKNCILNDSVDGYFKAGGRLMAYWANPGSMADDTAFDDNKSICYTNLKTELVDSTKKLPVIGPDDCKLIELKAKP